MVEEHLARIGCLDAARLAGQKLHDIFTLFALIALVFGQLSRVLPNIFITAVKARVGNLLFSLFVLGLLVCFCTISAIIVRNYCGKYMSLMSTSYATADIFPNDVFSYLPHTKQFFCEKSQNYFATITFVIAMVLFHLIN